MEILDMILDIDDGEYWQEIWNKTPGDIEETWDDTLTNVQERVKEYYKAINDRQREPEQYLNLVLPQYWQIVRALNISRWGVGSLPSDSRYDVGIFLVGFSSLPIALSIAEIQPRQKIYFLHSEDTFDRCDEIIDRIKKMFEDPPIPFCPLIDGTVAKNLIALVRDAERREIADPSDPVSTFQQIKDIIDNVRGPLEDNVRIALDLTGGKKTMIGGGFTAGSIYSISPKCDMFYVDSQEYNSRQGTPIPGTEFLTQLENPYDVYNVQSVGQAEELFYEHNYEAAMHLWDEVQKKLGDHADRYGLQNEQDAIKKNHCMADCYSLWDTFDYEAAADSARDNGNLWGYSSKHVKGSIDVLDILCRVGGRRMLFDLANEERVIHYAMDRYQNGIRTQASDKLDDAMVRFTQVIEMLCIYKICQIASTSNLIENTTNESLHETWCADEGWRISPLIKFLFGETSDYDYEYRISDCSEFLREADYIRVSDIIELIQPRNHFIHFTRRVSLNHAVQNTNNLKELAKKFLKNLSRDYCHGTGLSFDELLELHEFREL